MGDAVCSQRQRIHVFPKGPISGFLVPAQVRLSGEKTPIKTLAGRAARPHELSSGCGVRPNCCMRPKKFETIQDEEILLFPPNCTN